MGDQNGERDMSLGLNKCLDAKIWGQVNTGICGVAIGEIKGPEPENSDP